MELQIKGKQRICRHCKGDIYTFQPRYKAVEGYYCFNDAVIKKLHDGAMKFIKGVVNG